MSVQTCPVCSYILPPPRSWDAFVTAEHEWVHLDHLARRHPDDQAARAAALTAARVYIARRDDRERATRKRLTDPLHDDIGRLEWDLADARARIATLEEDLHDARRSSSDADHVR